MMKRQLHSGFSLIELLLAIFILGIGIISIAALLPAGIRQQQRAADDLLGPIVANNALTLLRSRLKPDDFGYCEVFDENNWSPNLCDDRPSLGQANDWPTICGDWMWRRPAFIPSDYGDSSNPVDVTLRGAIDIFGYSGSTFPTIYEQWSTVPEVPGIPYNKEKYPNLSDFDGPTDIKAPPVIRITSAERQYPIWEGDPRSVASTPYDPTNRSGGKYYWDCMFRRYEQRILVAVFVYRVIEPNQTIPYVVDTTDWETPQLPYHRALVGSSTGAWNATTNTLSGTNFDNPNDPGHQWQGIGQWVVDQNAHVHQVQRGRRKLSDDFEVKLVSAPSAVFVSPSISTPGNAAPSNVNWWEGAMQDPPVIPSSTNGGMVTEGVVTDIWYLPTSDAMNRTIVPVFATVEEL
ncbi:MAG: prepilin-type N-terminal cleavage/methylation domain-containing protein [Phycisphaerales bacterium]|jgi:prepilin-type N-terminal cleavage/methylation domain-containing protein|nr:prepilin-type N-terminal cleavage/methylation domain-containing protein [Phycisphaerales bacterium]